MKIMYLNLKKILLMLLSLLVIALFVVSCAPKEASVDKKLTQGDLTEIEKAQLPADLKEGGTALAGKAVDFSGCIDADSTSVYDKNSLLTKSTTTYAGGSKEDKCYTWYKGTPQEKTRLIEGTCKNKKFLYWYATCSDYLGKDYVCKEGKCGKNITSLSEAKILEVPLPEKAYCFWQQNQDLLDCADFYKDDCGSWGCQKVSACPQYYNPVYDSKGIFYPSACWAEHLGIKEYKYGYSEEMLQFMRDLWYTPKNEQLNYYQVPSPDLEFSYHGSGLEGDKNGVFLSSTLWKNSTDFIRLDFNINTSTGKQFSTYFNQRQTSFPVSGTKKVLLVFMPFDEAYPQEVLFNWTKTYEPLLNDYFKKKQNVPNPIQFDFTTVKIDLPSEIEKPAGGDYWFSETDVEKIYNAAIQKAPSESEYQILIISAIFLNGYGGAQHSWKNLVLIEAPLIPLEPYSENNQKQGLNALTSFQFMMGTISHELLHTVGLSSDHFPMGYGTTYLSFIGQNVDKVTGKEIVGVKECDFFSSSPDYYAVKLPEALKIFVGKEPSWLIKEESSSGNCVMFGTNIYLKDFDNDGEYEIMYSNNLIGMELQRTLGWVDIDGDGITELIDPTPYGGYKEYTLTEKPDGKIGGKNGLTLVPLGEISFGECKFEKVKLEDGQEGLIPLKCEEFITFNLYPKLKYNYEKIQKEYGVVFLPRLN